MANEIFCNIMKCSRCDIRKNQKPLLDSVENVKADVLWVGLSAKKTVSDDEVPLSEQTNSGKVIRMAEEEIRKATGNISFRKTNLVKCLPLDENGKLRYPNSDEMENCMNNLDLEIKEISPKIVFLLGNIVEKKIGKHLGLCFKKKDTYTPIATLHDEIFYASICHPSYMWVYKKSDINQYIHGIVNIVENVL